MVKIEEKERKLLTSLRFDGELPSYTFIGEDGVERHGTLNPHIWEKEGETEAERRMRWYYLMLTGALQPWKHIQGPFNFVVACG